MTTYNEIILELNRIVQSLIKVITHNIRKKKCQHFSQLYE